MDKKENLKLQESIMERIDLSCQMSEEEVRERIDEQIKKESKKRCLEVTARERLRKEIFHSIRQLGILQELIENPEITEIMVNGTEGIFIERNGKLHKLDISFDSPEKLRHVIKIKVPEINCFKMVAFQRPADRFQFVNDTYAVRLIAVRILHVAVRIDADQA